jgi:hypothetical protein
VNADTRYGYRAWDRRPGDDVDPSVALGPEEVIVAVEMLAPPPEAAGPPVRFLGAPRSQPTISDVLSLSPATGAAEGQPGTLRPSTGPY